MKFKKLAIISVILIFFFTVLSTFLGAEETLKTGTIAWNKYDDGLKLASKANKPIMVDFYTDWCGWCKKLDKVTYADSTIAKYVKDHFIAVKINGESKETLKLPDGPMNGVGVARSFGVRGYPCIWFLDSKGVKINNMSGYRPPEVFIYFLKFVGDGLYKSQTFEEYVQKITAKK
jgi:thioredoxin-related protein